MTTIAGVEAAIPTQPDPPNVHQAIAHAMRLVRAVGKWGKNTHEGYGFKRIDDFMTAANEALGQAGVHIVPRVLTRLTDETHKTSSGNVMRWVDLEVAFDFCGPAGDFVTVVTWGEGRDSSDKATNKAMTAAMKYALMYALMVPTEDLQDADSHSPESGRQQAPTLEEAKRDAWTLWQELSGSKDDAMMRLDYEAWATKQGLVDELVLDKVDTALLLSYAANLRKRVAEVKVAFATGGPR